MAVWTIETGSTPSSPRVTLVHDAAAIATARAIASK